MHRPDAPRLLPLAAAATAVAVTVAGWIVLPAPPVPVATSDWFTFYQPVGRSLADGRGWVPPGGAASAATYPPGYPLLVAAAFAVGDRLGASGTAAIRALNLLCVGLGGAIVASLVAALAGTRRALAGAALWGAFPPTLWLTMQPLSEVPFMVLLAAAFASWRAAARDEWFRAGLWFASGALAGAAALVRPIAIFLALLLALLAFVPGWTRAGSRARAAGAALVLAGWALALLPWQVWATARTGRTVLISDGGTASMVDGLTWAVREKGYRAPSALSPPVRSSMEGFAALGRDATIATIAGEALRQVADRPSGLLRLAGWKLVRPLWGTDSGRLEPVAGVIGLATLALFALALWTSRGDAEAGTALAAAGAVLALFWAMAATVLPIARYVAPPLGLIAGLLPLALPRPHPERGRS